MVTIARTAEYCQSFCEKFLRNFQIIARGGILRGCVTPGPWNGECGRGCLKSGRRLEEDHPPEQPMWGIPRRRRGWQHESGNLGPARWGAVLASGSPPGRRGGPRVGTAPGPPVAARRNARRGEGAQTPRKGVATCCAPGRRAVRRRGTDRDRSPGRSVQERATGRRRSNTAGGGGHVLRAGTARGPRRGGGPRTVPRSQRAGTSDGAEAIKHRGRGWSRAARRDGARSEAGGGGPRPVPRSQHVGIIAASEHPRGSVHPGRCDRRPVAVRACGGTRRRCGKSEPRSGPVERPERTTRATRRGPA